MAPLTLLIRCANATKYTVTVESEGTVLDLKKAIEETSQIPAGEQRLIVAGKIMKDEQPLSSYGVKPELPIHLVRSLTSSSSSTASASASTTSASTSTTAAPAPTSQPFGNPASAPGLFGNPFANPYAGAGTAAPFPAMGPGGMPDVHRMQQQLMQNPEMMRNIMNSPMMQSMMSNPDLIRNMIVNNPQMRQVLDANPQLNHVLSDPQLMRQAMEYMQNPAAMREMMRSQDLAMSQIENHPEGFNALRRMYEDVQEPLMQATADAMAGSSGLGSTGSTPSSSVGATTQPGTRPNTAALPNPWAAPGSASTGSAPSTGAAPAMPGFGGFGAAPGAAPGGFPNPYAGLGGMGAMGAGPMGGAVPDMDTTLNMMQNPAMQAMMQQMLSNPAFLDQMAASNPMLRQMLDTNPHMRSMMTSPQFVQQMTDPNTLRAVMQLQRSGLLPGPGMPGSGMPGAPGMANPFGAFPPALGFGGTPGATPGLDFSSLLQTPAQPGGFGPAPILPPAPAPVPPLDPATRFATQLQQMRDMGFTDQERALQALAATNGDVTAAVERMLAP